MLIVLLSKEKILTVSLDDLFSEFEVKEACERAFFKVSILSGFIILHKSRFFYLAFVRYCTMSVTLH